MFLYIGLHHDGAGWVWTDGTALDYGWASGSGGGPGKVSISESAVGVWGVHGLPDHTHGAVCKTPPS